MKLHDLPMYLVGSRGAILRIAASRWALVVGAMLVFSGSLARNYDGSYLAKEWDVLLHGVVVSLGNSFILFSLMFIATRMRSENNTSSPTIDESVPIIETNFSVFGGRDEPGVQTVSPRSFWSGYLSFLGLFWMSAPMAWLYGIPYERWFTPVEAVQANLNTLTAVSIWRVALMTRVLSVIFGAQWLPTLFLVLLFSDVAIVIGAFASPKPLIDFMGGMQHSPEDEMLSSTNFLTMFYGIVSLPVWLVGGIWAMAVMRGRWNVAHAEWGRAPRWLLGLALFALAAWIIPMTRTQIEQRNRWEADTLLRAGKINDALTMMSSKGRGEFPPIWDPAPKLGWGETRPMIEEVAETILTRDTPTWIGKMYTVKSRRYLFSYNEGGWQNLETIVKSPQPYASGGDAGLLARLRLHEKYDDTLSESDRETLLEGIATLERWLAKGKATEPN